MTYNQLGIHAGMRVVQRISKQGEGEAQNAAHDIIHAWRPKAIVGVNPAKQAICDWADGTKDNPRKEQDQQQAAAHAALVVYCALSLGSLCDEGSPTAGGETPGASPEGLCPRRAVPPVRLMGLHDREDIDPDRLIRDGLGRPSSLDKDLIETRQATGDFDADPGVQALDYLLEWGDAEDAPPLLAGSRAGPPTPRYSATPALPASASGAGFPAVPVLRVLQGHRNWVNACAFSPDGSRLLSAGADGTLRLWDAETGALLRIHAVFRAGSGGDTPATPAMPFGNRPPTT